MLWSSSASAQDLSIPEYQLQTMNPATGPADYIDVYSSAVAPHLDFDFGFYFDIADDPLKTPSTTAEFNAAVERQNTLSLIGNLGLFDMFEVGILVPVTVLQSGGDLIGALPAGADPDTELGAFGINDPRIGGKYKLFDLLQDPVGLAFVLNGYLPLGTNDTFTSDDGFGLEGMVVGEMFIIRGIRVAANLGYRYRQRTTVIRDAYLGDAFLWGLATNVPLWVSRLDAILEFDGAVSLADRPDARTGVRSTEVPAEVKLGVRYAFNQNWTLSGGFGTALNDEAVGTPDFRAWIGINGRWVSGGAWGYDYDSDGIYGAYDKCPDEPEDFDGFEDGDGCPDYDNDGDGIPDDADRCDNTPEGVEIGPDGCPDNDLDGDGIPNDRDKCPEDPEDRDRFEDTDGCPDIDNDGDGIPDTSDTCPNEPENFNDFLDDDGCPDDPNDKVHLSRDRIIITEQVYFETAKAVIKTESYPILDAVADVMKANPQVLKIRVEGHTDSRGSDDMNMQLSKDRAASVMKYLVDKGIAENRLESIGYGEEQPIADNETAKGRSLNRRVEFTIIEMREY
jgi:outer membrane protein OmpA-like peptidoglycan-associated protein